MEETMASNTRRRYDKKFKEAAVKLVVEDGLMVSEVERRLETGTGVLNRWVRNYLNEKAKQDLPEGELEKVHGEVARLQKEMARLSKKHDDLIRCVKDLSS
jgi:transposase